MNNSMIFALVGLWVSGFIFGVIFYKIRHGKHMKVNVLVPIDKDKLHQMVNEQAEKIRKECMTKEEVCDILCQMQNSVMNMKSDRMTGDTPLIIRDEVVFMINHYISDIRKRKHWGYKQ